MSTVSSDQPEQSLGGDPGRYPAAAEQDWGACEEDEPE